MCANSSNKSKMAKNAQKEKKEDKKRKNVLCVACQLSQTLPLLTPSLSTVGWFAKTPKPTKQIKNGKNSRVKGLLI